MNIPVSKLKIPPPAQARRASGPNTAPSQANRAKPVFAQLLERMREGVPSSSPTRQPRALKPLSGPRSAPQAQAARPAPESRLHERVARAAEALEFANQPQAALPTSLAQVSRQGTGRLTAARRGEPSPDTVLLPKGGELKEARGRIGSRQEQPRRGVGEADVTPRRVKLTVVDRRVQAPRSAGEPLEAQGPGRRIAELSSESITAGSRRQEAEIPVIWDKPSLSSARTAEVPTVRMVFIPPQLYHQLHGEFVERAKVILKDAGGELRMTLRPPTLGHLRLSVTLEEKVLKAQIVVDNETVRAMVESQLDSLLRSFQEAGFQPLELRVNVAGEDGSRHREQRQHPHGRPGAPSALENEPLEDSTRDYIIRLEA